MRYLTSCVSWEARQFYFSLAYFLTYTYMCTHTHICVCACSVTSVMSNSLRPYGLQPARLLCSGISQARILEWFDISFSRGSSRPSDWTWVSCIAGRFFTNWATREAHVCVCVCVCVCVHARVSVIGVGTGNLPYIYVCTYIYVYKIGV